jgi:pyruvate dehydrogenase (quinone)
MTTFETVADQLVRDLVRMEVRRIYGLVGDSLNSISDAVLVGLG